ncbi:MAG: polymerase primary sigma factor [Synergistales bacterium]|jgi:RNA polymerase primary sigma factor|nr:polymerase primary sigma factor [Synergistales bacterium]
MGRKKQGSVCFLPPKRAGVDFPEESPEEEAELDVVEVDVDDEERSFIEDREDEEDEGELKRTIYELFHADIKDIPLLTPEEERELSRRIQEEGDKEAFDRFVMGNLRLVIACAKKVKDRMGRYSILSFMDLIQEGVLGLMTAVSRFDYKRNTRFSTYGISWIYQRMKMAMLQHRYGLTIPGYACTSVHVMSEHIHAYRAGKFDEIPADVDMERIKALSRIVGAMIPIDYGDDGDSTGYALSPERLAAGESFLAGEPAGEDWMDEIEASLFREEILRVLRQELTETEYEILCRRFGAGGYNAPETLADIARSCGKSSEHVRSVVNGTLEKLKESELLARVHCSWEGAWD